MRLVHWGIHSVSSCCEFRGWALWKNSWIIASLRLVCHSKMQLTHELQWFSKMKLLNQTHTDTQLHILLHVQYAPKKLYNCASSTCIILYYSYFSYTEFKLRINQCGKSWKDMFVVSSIISEKTVDICYPRVNSISSLKILAAGNW